MNRMHPVEVDLREEEEKAKRDDDDDNRVRKGSIEQQLQSMKKSVRKQQEMLKTLSSQITEAEKEIMRLRRKQSSADAK